MNAHRVELAPDAILWSSDLNAGCGVVQFVTTDASLILTVDVAVRGEILETRLVDQTGRICAVAATSTRV